MALPGLFPLYPDPIPMKYQVSLALPPLPVSEISKAIGITASSSFLVPNIDFLKSFAEGNLGIADKLAKETLYKNFNHPIAQNNEKVLKSYAKLNDIDIPDLSKYKDKVNGKIKFPKEDITVPPIEGLGLKAFEKTIMTSIFETQKPYLEVAKLVIGNVAKIEDIIARSMPLLGVPLKTKSLKPVSNNGVPNGRPKAIGYKNGAELKSALSKLQTVSKTGSEIKIDKNGKATRDVTPTGTASTSGGGDNTNWQILSTVYSTGVYVPGVNYQYNYIDLPANATKADETADLNLADDDPYNKYKPERIILGVFRADGTPLDPSEKLKTIGLNGNNVVYNSTPFSRADWLLKSPKWHLPPYLSDTRSAIYTWPSFATPTYKWVKGVFTQDSKTSPGDGWEVKKYKEGDKNLITGDDAIKGDPIIVSFDANQINEYKSYFTDTVRYKINQTEDLEQADKDKYTNDIVNQLNIQSHIQNVYLYGQNKSSVYKQVNNKPAFPDKLKLAFKPFQIYSANAEKDPKLSAYNKAHGQQPGFIWIDPEADYETKVIRVDPTTKIKFSEAQGQPAISSTIKSFVKNKVIFSFVDGQKFNIDIVKNNLPKQSFTDVSEYIIENWNYSSNTALSPERRLENGNSYNVSIWSKNPNKNYSTKSSEIYRGDVNWVELLKVGTQWSYKEFYFDINNTQFEDSYRQFINQNTNNIDSLYSKYLSNKQYKISYIYGTTSSIPVDISLDKIFSKMRKYKTVENGKKRLPDGSSIEVINEFISKWFYLKRTYNNSNLPGFGKERKFAINYNGTMDKQTGDLQVNVSDKEIPLYQIKAENSDFPYGKIIDPSKITNEDLTKDELYSKGKYGVGDDEDPQEIEVIQRYMLTDLDTESYYIIEGVLAEKNDQAGTVPAKVTPGNSEPAASYYRMPHALGATKVFLSMVVDIVSKLIPQIVKLIALFKNPGSFIIEIIKEKLGDGFSIFSKEAFKTFEKAKAIKDELTNDATNKVTNKANDANNVANSKVTKTSDKVNKLKDTFKNSPLSNVVFVDKKGNYKFLLDGLAMLPFEIFGLSLPFGAELNFDNIPNSPIKLIVDAKMAKVKNLQDFLIPKIKDFKGPGSTGVAPQGAGKLAPGLNISDIKSMESPIYKSNTRNLVTNENDVIVDVKYSTGEFINGIDYNYIYINQDEDKVLKNATQLLNTPNEAVNLDTAKKVLEDVNDALKKNPTNDALKDLLKKLRGKLGNLADNTQPLIKMLLGMVTIPIKIVGGIIEYLMNFFKSLTNPLTLPAKIVELLSFSWIMDIMSPVGLMKLIGIKFEPKKLAEWLALTKIPKPKIPEVAPKIPDGFDLPSLKFYKDATPKGRFFVPDDFDIADLNQFFSAPFLPKLPTYTARQFRENPTRPLKLVLPTLCFFEKIINGIIDFIWSTLGIEALIPPPHIKLCGNSVDPDINDAIKLANDMNKTGTEPVPTGGTFSNGSNVSIPTDADFLYDITLDDGTVVKGLNYEQMQKYIKDHENIGYDFKF